MVNIAFVARVALVGAAAVTLHLWLGVRTDLVQDVGSVGAFVTAVGTLYSVLTAFTIVSVWTEFTDTDRAIKREARQLAELWRYVGYVSDVQGVASARRAIEAYRDAVVYAEWPAMLAGSSLSTADHQFFAMADAVNAVNVATTRDVPAWTEAVRTLGEASEARSDRVLLVSLRMPHLLRLLIYTATATLIIGMALLGFTNEYIGCSVVALTVAVSLLVLDVINDIDDPFGGAWGVTSVPFERIVFQASDPSLS